MRAAARHPRPRRHEGLHLLEPWPSCGRGSLLGVGIDLVETSRLAAALARGGHRFQRHAFTAAERLQCARRLDRTRALALRFAAKEAFLKALGRGLGEGIALRQIEVICGPAGRPVLRLSGEAADAAQARGVRRIHVRLSHDREVTSAVVVLEGCPA